MMAGDGTGGAGGQVPLVAGGRDEPLDGWREATLGFQVRVKEIDHRADAAAREILNDVMAEQAAGTIDSAIRYHGRRERYWMQCLASDALGPGYFGLFSQPSGALLGWFSLMSTLRDREVVDHDGGAVEQGVRVAGHDRVHDAPPGEPRALRLALAGGLDDGHAEVPQQRLRLLLGDRVGEIHALGDEPGERDGAGLDGLVVHLPGGEVFLVQLFAGEGVAPLRVARPVEDVDRPYLVLDEVERAVEEPAEVVDEAARLVDEHEAVARIRGVVDRDLEELVQPRGAVDGDGLARNVAVANLDRLQELVELGSHNEMRKIST